MLRALSGRAQTLDGAGLVEPRSELGTFFKPECEELIRRKDFESLRSVFADFDPEDVAEVLDDLPGEDSGIVFRLLPRRLAASTFEHLPLNQQNELFEALAEVELSALLNDMAPDDRTRIFEELPAQVTRRALNTLRPEQLTVARQLLGYLEKSAGRYMTPEYLALSPSMTGLAALDYVRSHGRAGQNLAVLYVIDSAGKLIGNIRLSTLILTHSDTTLDLVRDQSLVSVKATDRRER